MLQASRSQGFHSLGLSFCRGRDVARLSHAAGILALAVDAIRQDLHDAVQPLGGVSGWAWARSSRSALWSRSMVMRASVREPGGPGDGQLSEPATRQAVNHHLRERGELWRKGAIGTPSSLLVARY